MTTRLARGGALLVVAALGGVAAITWSDDDAAFVVPSPLFDDVEQLKLASLPQGWSRCGGAKSDRADATERWWAQTFGPAHDGECSPLVTVTQIPPEDRFRFPEGATNGGIGEEPGRTGAKHWSDPSIGSRGLYTTGSGGLQRLVVEGCCGDDAIGAAFDHVANAARDATREQEPARCTAEHSDLDQESFLDNYFSRQQRVTNAERCPVRGDIAAWRTEPPGHHCFPNVTFLTVGSPVGTPLAADARTYVRDESGELRAGQGRDPRLDLDAELPTTAIDSGFRLGAKVLWIDEERDGLIYVVSHDGVEAWPLNLEPQPCL